MAFIAENALFYHCSMAFMLIIIITLITFSIFFLARILEKSKHLQDTGMTRRKKPRSFCYSVSVENLRKSVTEHKLEEAFSSYGPLRNVSVARNPPGSAFVEFIHKKAVERFDGLFNNKKSSVIHPLGISVQRLINSHNSNNYPEPFTQHSSSATQQLQENGRPQQLQRNDRPKQLQGTSRPKQLQGTSRPQQLQRSVSPQQLQRNVSPQLCQKNGMQGIGRMPQRQNHRSQQHVRSSAQHQCNSLSGVPSRSSSVSESNNASDEIKCVICFDTVENCEMKYIPCGHSFHARCCDEWFLNHGSCPICRAVVAPKKGPHLPTINNLLSEIIELSTRLNERVNMIDHHRQDMLAIIRSMRTELNG